MLAIIVCSCISLTLLTMYACVCVAGDCDEWEERHGGARRS